MVSEAVPNHKTYCKSKGDSHFGHHPNLGCFRGDIRGLLPCSAARAQVAHRLEKSTKLFKQLDGARYLADLFLTLCRVDDWEDV